MRIALMVIRLILLVPYYFGGIWWHGVRKNYNFEEAYRFVQKVARSACKAGRVRLEAEGIENYDYIVINDELEQCVEDIHGIVMASRCRVNQSIKLIEEISKELSMISKGEEK